MKRILIIEDEQTLLHALERGLKVLPGVEVQGCDSVEAALECLIQTQPACLVLDLNLPGLSGIDLLEDLAYREPRPQVLVTTAFGAEHRAALDRFPDVEVLEKPVPIELLRERVQARLGMQVAAAEGAPVFAVGDYLQLAAMTQASMLIEAESSEGREGRIEVWKGEIWSASYPPLRGTAAVEALLFEELRRLAVQPLQQVSGEREVFGETSRLLLAAACARDENRLLGASDLAGSAPEPRLREDFEVLFTAALAAYLERRYSAALDLFQRCLDLRPGDPRATHNLNRLKRTVGMV